MADNPIQAGVNKALTWWTSILLLGSLTCCGLFALAGLNLTGMDDVMGETGAKIAVVGFDNAAPAMVNIVDPAWQEAKTRGEKFMAEIGPEGQTTWGGFTIDWDKFGGDNSSETNNDGDSNSDQPAADSAQPPADNSQPTEVAGVEATPTPPPAPSCVDVLDQYAQASLDSWKVGDWESAKAQIDFADPKNCLAQRLAKEYYKPFELAVGRLYQQVGIAQADFSTPNRKALEVAIVAVYKLNPKFMDQYAASRFLYGHAWLTENFDANQAMKYLEGSTITVVSQGKKEWAMLLTDDKDEFNVSIAFGRFSATYVLNRAQLKGLENALGLQSGALQQAPDPNAGKAGSTYQVPGNLYIPKYYDAPVPAP